MFGRLKRLFKKEMEEEEVKRKKDEGKFFWVLKKKSPKGGWRKVMKLAESVDIEDIYPHLDAGVYRLDRYEYGKTEFQVEWGPVEVLGETQMEEERERTRKRTAGGIMNLLELEISEEELERLQNVATFLHRLTGRVQLDDALNALSELRRKFDDVAPMMGYVKASAAAGSGDEKVPVEGKVPASWVYVPALVDKVFETAEKRLVKWGVLLGEEKREEEIEIPPPPKME